MHLRNRFGVPKAARFVGLAMMLGMTGVLTAAIGASPSEAASASGWTVYVGMETGNVTPVDTATNTEGTPIPLPALASFPGIAITPNGATAYVTNPYAGTVTPIDTATNTARTPITVTGKNNPGPSYIAITPNGATAYVTNNSNFVWPINLATNTVGNPITVEQSPETDIAIAPDGATAYVTDASDGIVTPINLSTNTPETPISISVGPEAIAITPNGATAYVTGGDGTNGGGITPIDLATNTVGTPIPVPGPAVNPNVPDGIAIAPNGTTAYVEEGTRFGGPSDVTPVNLVTNTSGTPIPVGSTGNDEESIAITPDGATVYVAGAGAATLTPINTATNTAETPITDDSFPYFLAITPDQAPVAQLSVTPAVAGQPTGFDASASTVAVGTITSYAWNFGDGSTATTSTPMTTHTYATAGPYTATVTETDSAGTSTTQIFTGQTMSNNGGPSAVASQNFTVNSPLPTTSVLIPSNGAALSGSTYLDASASNSTSVEFLLFGGSYGTDAPVLCTATPTIYGWLCAWNTTSVPDGSYVLMSEAFNSAGSTFSSGVGIIVDNTPPSTAVIIPPTGATLSGKSAILDATASASYGVGIAKVHFVVSAGSLNKVVIGTATPTIYGYLDSWNTTSVPNGTYMLQSTATDRAGNIAYSPVLLAIVYNTPPTTSVLIPSNGTTLNGTSAILDAAASAFNGVGIAKVQFLLTGGIFNQTVIGTAAPTLYGYIALWDITSVADGTYALQSLATDGAGNTTYSAGITIAVGN